MFALSAVVELAAEPAFIFCQANLLVGSRVLLEGIAQIVRTVATVTLVVHYPELGLLIFGATQLLAAVVLMVGYYASVQRHLTAQQDKALHIASIVELAPQPRAHAHAHAHATEARAVLARVASFVKNSFIKQLLTEGERYIMTIFNVVGFAEQGVFDVVANLGSLVARFLFLPIGTYSTVQHVLPSIHMHVCCPRLTRCLPATRAEENYYVFFSMLLGASVPREDAGRNAALAAHALAVLLKLGLLIGLTFVAFGPAYTHILLDLYGGRNLSAGIGPYLLAWYCVYVLAMALNGIGMGAGVDAAS
jgi:oligosaccharide translocation protein RFT1